MAAGSGTSWGNRVRDWMCGVHYEWSYTAGQPSATVTAQCVWRSVYKAFDVDYCDAWLVCDGASDGAFGEYHVVTDGTTDYTEVQISRAFTVPATVSARTVRVAASFVMPDVQIGSSYAEATFELPGNVSSAPDAPQLSLTRTDDYSLSWQAVAAFSAGAPTESLTVELDEGGGWRQVFSGGVTSASRSVSGTVSSAPNRTYSMRARATNAAGASGWCDAVTVNTTPGAVSSLGGAYDQATGKVTLTWSNGTNTGTVRVRRSSDGGASWTVLAASHVGTSYIDQAPPLGAVRYEVTPHAADGEGRIYGPSRSVDVAAASTADYPQASMAAVTVNDLPWTASWTASPGAHGTPIASQVLRLIVEGELSREWRLGASQRSVEVDGLDGDGTLVLTVVDSSGLASSATAGVLRDFLPPSAPAASVTASGNGLRFTVNDGHASGHAQTASIAILDGSAVLADGMSDGDRYDHKLAPINVAREYTVVASAANGLTSSTAVTATLDADWGAVDMCGGSWRIELDPRLSENLERGGEALELEGRTAPTWYPDGTLSRSVKLSFAVIDGFAALRRAAESADVCDVRSPDGDLWHGHPSWGFDRGAGTHTVSLALTEVIDGD